jgi:hypothetical protein
MRAITGITIRVENEKVGRRVSTEKFKRFINFYRYQIKHSDES